MARAFPGSTSDPSLGRGPRPSASERRRARRRSAAQSRATLGDLGPNPAVGARVGRTTAGRNRRRENRLARNRLLARLRRQAPEAFEDRNQLLSGRHGDVQTAKAILAERRAKREEEDKSILERQLEHGLVGFIDKDVSDVGRKIVFGSENPSNKDLAIAAAADVLGGGAAALGARGLLKVGGRVPAVLRGSSKKADDLIDAAKGTKAARRRAVAKRKAARENPKPEKPPSPRKRAKTKRQLDRKRASGQSRQPGRGHLRRAGHEQAERAKRFAAGPVPVAIGGTDAPRTAIEGMAEATWEDPGKVAKATGKAVPGIATAMAQIPASIALSAYRGTREGLDEAGLPGGKDYSGREIGLPVRRMAEENWKGTKDFANTYLSGDKERIKEATKEAYGLTPLAVALPPALRVLRPAHRAVRDSARASTAARRAEGKRKITRPTKRHAAVDYDPERPVFDAAYRRRQRKAEAKRAASAQARARHEQHERAERFLAAARRASRKLPKHTIIRQRANGQEVRVRVQAGDALHFLASRGIPRDPAKAERLIQQIHNRLVDREDIAPDKLTTRDVTEYLLENPDVLRSDDLWRAVREYKSQADSLGYSERARVLPVAVEEGIALPEERVPAALRDKTDAVDVAGLRREIDRDAAALRRAVKRGDGEEARAIGRRLGEKRRALRRELDPEERRAILDDLEDATPAERREALKAARREKAIREDENLLSEYLAEVAEVMRDKGYEAPAYTTRVDARTHTSPQASATGGQISALGRIGADRRETGALLRSGAVDESFGALVRGSVQAPVSKRQVFAMWRDFISDRSVRLDNRVEFTSADAGRLIDQGRINTKDFALIPRQLYKRTFDALQREGDWTDADFESKVVAPVREALDAQRPAKGRVYRIVPREALTELMAQTSRASDLERGLANFASLQGRILLGTNPAWLTMQFIAEGLQAFAAVGPHPLRVRRDLKAARALREDEAWGFAAMAGETPGVKLGISDIRTRLDVGDTEAAAGALSAMNKTKLGRFIKGAVKLESLGDIDRWKSGVIRRGVAAAHIDREINGFMAGIKNLWRAEDDVFKQLRGKSLEEQLAYFAKNPKAARRIESYLDDVMGNWRALTRYERLPASVLAFYPFLRMSLRWTFKSFPERHPIKASILYTLGAVQAEQVAELLQGDPSYFSQWAMVPLYTGEGDEAVGLPLGSAAPGANALVEAMGGAEDPYLALTRTLTPAAGPVITLATGRNPFTSEDEENQGRAALAQLLSFAAPVRLADTLDFNVPGLSAITEADEQFDPDSPTSKLYEGINEPAGIRAARSTLFRALPVSFAEERRRSTVRRWNEQKDDSPESKVAAEVWEAVFSGDDEDVDALVQRRKRGKLADQRLDALAVQLGGEERDLTDAQSKRLRQILGGIFIPNEAEGSGGDDFWGGAGKTDSNFWGK